MSNEDRRKVFTQPREAAAWLTGHPSRMVRNDNGLLIACFAIHGHWTFRECKRPTFHVALADNDAPFVAVADEQGEIPAEVEYVRDGPPPEIVKALGEIEQAVWAVDRPQHDVRPTDLRALAVAIVDFCDRTFQPKGKDV